MRKPTVARGSKVDRALRLAVLLALLAFALYIPQAYNQYRVFQFTMVLVYAPAILGLNLLTGYNGQISLGHSFFFGTGAYLSAILMDTHGWHYLLTIPVSGAVTFVLGFLFGIPALRLHGLYLALVTLALAVVFPPIVKSRHLNEVTGGAQGIVVPRVEPQFGLAPDQWLYYVCLAVALVLFVLAWNLMRGRLGRAIIAIRDNPVAAQTMGVDNAAVKTRVFAFSALFAGVAGSLYTFVVAFVAPESFTVTLAVSFLAGIVVGGLATISGAVFGALFIQFVPVFAQEVNKALSGLIYGLALILFMFVMPGGVVAVLRRARDVILRLEGTPFGASSADVQPALQAASFGGVTGREAVPQQPTEERGSA